MATVANAKYMKRVEEPWDVASLTQLRRFDKLYVREITLKTADAYAAAEGVTLPTTWKGDLTVPYLILYGNNPTGYSLDIDMATGKLRLFSAGVEHAAGTLGATLNNKKITIFILGVKDAAQA